jgi:RimJ/RimL family protein N-acetyltransferase
MADVPCLFTERLLLRPLTVEDDSWFIPLHQHPDVMQFSLRGILSEEVAHKIIEGAIRSYEVRGYGIMGCYVRDSLRPIGFCGVCLRELEGQLYPELGYRLFPEFWAQGYATEAASIVKADVFERLRLPQIFSFIDPKNSRSIRVAEKIGERFAFHSYYYDLLLAIYTAYNPHLALQMVS